MGIELHCSVGQLTRAAHFRASRQRLDLSAGNNSAAKKTETFVIQGMPLPELVKPAQHSQFICVA
jgi:hypothetical protein